MVWVKYGFRIWDRFDLADERQWGLLNLRSDSGSSFKSDKDLTKFISGRSQIIRSTIDDHKIRVGYGVRTRSGLQEEPETLKMRLAT